MYGDADPLDAYDAGDPPDVRAALLARVIVSLPDRPHAAARRAEVVRLLRALADELAA